VQRPIIDKANGEKEILFRNEINLPSTTFASYGFYNYPAKFIPHVPLYVLKKYAHPGMKIFDPFAGYGTVGIASKILGFDYELWDLNPLLETLHAITTLDIREVEVNKILTDMNSSDGEFIPDWSRLNYWYNEEILNFLFKIWGYYHSLIDTYYKILLSVPLLKTSRYFSYDDMQRQKLSKSKKSTKRIESLLKKNWKEIFYNKLENEIKSLLRGLKNYHNMSPKSVNYSIKAGIDTLNTNLEETKNILITSPPYLQSQEYMRQAKLDLYWMGYKERFVKRLSKLEIPYRDINPINIQSDTYFQFRGEIENDSLCRTYDNYFYGILGALDTLQENIDSYLCIFVGRASMEGRSVPLDRIFTEHFTNLGLKHKETLVDTIISRRLFNYNNNPATGRKDVRTVGEYLIVLKKS